MITSDIKLLRDPFYLRVDGVHYLYGSGWVAYKNTTDDFSQGWVKTDLVVEKPSDFAGDMWAPEVHVYKGAYYMFTTYRSVKDNHRGCVIFRSESAEGPFVPITNGRVTPEGWDSIDGTFYVDQQGQPWMVFVHEWTSTEDRVGRMAAAKLSEDLSHFISEPIELFRADEAPWADDGITDGCFMYRTAKGSLIMTWSNFAPDGYSVGIARSDSGEIDGNWSQQPERIYHRGMFSQYDGGHGMLFRTEDGKLHMVLHSPNGIEGERTEMPVFFEVVEENDTLRLLP